jgi:predicted flap endonuclease-1-like 5' DNA nuclease
MDAFLWFIVGILVGAGAAWIWLERKVAERQSAMEANYEGRLKHLHDEVGRADQAHEETKETLRGLMAERNAAAAAADVAAADLAAARREGERAKVEAARLAGELDSLRAELKERSAPQPAASVMVAAPGQPPVQIDATAQRLRAIDAKLRMLPAGSSARTALLAERTRLASTDSAVPAGAELPAAPPGAAPDDLEVIRGIGPRINGELRQMGIVTFAQLAALTPTQIGHLEEKIGFPGRVAREHWIEQARELLAKG